MGNCEMEPNHKKKKKTFLNIQLNVFHISIDSKLSYIIK